MTTNAPADLKPVRIMAALPGPTGTHAELWPDGLPIDDPLTARATLALIATRSDSRFIRDIQRSVAEFVAEPGDRLNDHLVRAAQELQTYALACRQARWERTPMPDSLAMRSIVLWHLIYATGWLDVAADPGSQSRAQDAALAVGYFFARVSNVPTPNDAEIAATGYSVAEFVTIKASEVLRHLIEKFQGSEDLEGVLDIARFRGSHVEKLQQAKRAFLTTALEDMHDVPAILQEGVLFTLDLLPKVPPLPK